MTAQSLSVHDLRKASFIDVHYHAGPDAFVRRHGVLECGRRYRMLNGWVVLKNHLGCTAAQAWEARAEGLPVSGSIVLNEIAGDLNWRTVERALVQQCDDDIRLIVHLPTVTGRKHRSSLVRKLSHPLLDARPILARTVTNEAGALLPAVLDVLRMARDHRVVISTGHASRDEVLRLVDAAVRLEVPRLMLNQPANPLTGLQADDLIELGQAPMVYVEQTALTYLLGYQGEEDFRRVLADVPRVVYSSDLGQTSQPDINEWHRLSAAWFDAFGLGAQRINQITHAYPLAMLT